MNPACDCYETGQWYLCCGSSGWDGMIMDAEADVAERETSLFATVYGKNAEDDLTKPEGIQLYPWQVVALRFLRERAGSVL